MSSAQAVTKRLQLRSIRGLCTIFDIIVGDSLSTKKEQAFANRIRGLSSEREKLLAIADEAARWAGSKVEAERRERRMLIANGTGCYRKDCRWNLNRDYPNLDNPL
jgi:hypothetical protein